MVDAGNSVDIAQALRTAATGLSVLGPTVQATLVAAASRGSTAPAGERQLPGDLPDGLTKREAEILAMMAGGTTNPEIAARLFISAHTVKSHINRIFAKTGSSDRATAVRYARDHEIA